MPTLHQKQRRRKDGASPVVVERRKNDRGSFDLPEAQCSSGFAQDDKLVVGWREPLFIPDFLQEQEAVPVLIGARRDTGIQV